MDNDVLRTITMGWNGYHMNIDISHNYIVNNTRTRHYYSEEFTAVYFSYLSLYLSNKDKGRIKMTNNVFWNPETECELKPPGYSDEIIIDATNNYWGTADCHEAQKRYSLKTCTVIYM